MDLFSCLPPSVHIQACHLGHPSISTQVLVLDVRMILVLVDPDRGLRIGILGMMTPPLIAVTRGTPIPKGRVVSLQSHSRGATIEEQQMRERETGSNLEP